MNRNSAIYFLEKGNSAFPEIGHFFPFFTALSSYGKTWWSCKKKKGGRGKERLEQMLMRPDNGKKEKVFSFLLLRSWGLALQKPTVPTFTGTKGGTLQTRKAFPAANSHFPPQKKKNLFLEFGLFPGDPTPIPHIPRQRKIRAHKKDTKKKYLLPFQDLRRSPRTRLFRPTPSPSPASTWARGRRRRCSPTRSGTCR